MTVAACRVRSRLPAFASPVGVAGAAAAAAGYLATIDVTGAGWWPGCVFHQLTGLDCPGCGGTRAVLALARGDLLAAAGHNLLTISLLPVLAVLWVQWLQVTLARRTAIWQPAPITSWTLTAAVIGFTIARNLDLPMARWLAAGAL